LDIAEYHKMHALEATYWWFQGRRDIILGQLGILLPRLRRETPGRPLRLLDVGCGTGMLLQTLEQEGLAVGLDFSPVALRYCRDRRLKNLGRADVRHLPIANDSVDLITALDLVEHIRDDAGLLGEFRRVLRPGGLALMSVPAHKNLWSGHDVALHHYRRYEKAEFRALVENAGLHIERHTSAVATVYPAAALFRRVKRRFAKPQSSPKTDEFPLPAILNSILRRVLTLEACWLRRHDLPFGLSILCLARKAP